MKGITGEFLYKVQSLGFYDTKKYRYRYGTFDYFDEGTNELRKNEVFERIPLDKLGTTAALAPWEFVDGGVICRKKIDTD